MRWAGQAREEEAGGTWRRRWAFGAAFAGVFLLTVVSAHPSPDEKAGEERSGTGDAAERGGAGTATGSVSSESSWFEYTTRIANKAQERLLVAYIPHLAEAVHGNCPVPATGHR